MNLDEEMLREFVKALKGVEKTNEEKQADLTWKIGVDTKIQSIAEKIDGINSAMKSGQGVERRVDFLERDLATLEKERLKIVAQLERAEGRKWQVILAVIIALMGVILPVAFRVYDNSAAIRNTQPANR